MLPAAGWLDRQELPIRLLELGFRAKAAATRKSLRAIKPLSGPFR